MAKVINNYVDQKKVKELQLGDIVICDMYEWFYVVSNCGEGYVLINLSTGQRYQDPFESLEHLSTSINNDKDLIVLDDAEIVVRNKNQ